MTVTQFEELQANYACKNCGTVGSCGLGRDPAAIGRSELDGRGIYCRKCEAWQFWCAKDGNHSKIGKARPQLKRGTIPEVWAAFGDRCLHCGITREIAEALGRECTVQHVPPYHVAGHDGWLYPYCSWCNQDAATRWKHTEALAKRFNLLHRLHPAGDTEDA